MSGRLIVFEGTDGSGKATQSRLLCEHLRRENIPYKNITFPRYGKPSAAMVQEYLDGNLGRRPGDVNAYAASLMFSMDRYASYKQDWGAFYEAGGLVIADRYTTSNAVHQASKLLPGERKGFLEWLFDLEYGKLGLPKPDLVLYLDMPTEITEKMMRQREAATGTHADRFCFLLCLGMFLLLQSMQDRLQFPAQLLRCAVIDKLRCGCCAQRL